MTGLIMLMWRRLRSWEPISLMSHPLRAGMVGALGEKGFAGVYTLVSFLTLGLMIWATRRVGAGPAPLWDAGYGAGFSPRC
jgi:uncharacterized membrane protein